ncbi:MAG TPA: hypothetical protein VFC82_00300 [Actinomycetaceae bacterium]|nr:hypothetical protein [Actinomycetaceae bacterium]
MERYPEDATPGARLDPLGREVYPNEPLPRRPWWQLALAFAGSIAGVAYMLFFAQALLDNISVIDGGTQPFVNAGIALTGFLLSLALLFGYVGWFRRRGNLAALVTLLVVTLAPLALVLL